MKTSPVVLLLISIGLFMSSCDRTMRVTIHGAAMLPTLADGEWAVAFRTTGGFERGDIVCFRYPRDQSKNFVKRIVGLPGERIEIRQGSVVLDGRELYERYVATANRSSEAFGPYTIPHDEYFVMGDNRSDSSDSRTWGTVSKSLIWAKLVLH